jgi:hypothetical protein
VHVDCINIAEKVDIGIHVQGGDGVDVVRLRIVVGNTWTRVWVHNDIERNIRVLGDSSSNEIPSTLKRINVEGQKNSCWGNHREIVSDLVVKDMSGSQRGILSSSKSSCVTL